MPFADIKTSAARSHGSGYDDVVEMAYYVSPKEGAIPQVFFAFGDKVLARVGWSVGDRVVIAEGTGKDSGCIQVRKVEDKVRGSLRLSRREGAKKANVSPLLTAFGHHAFPTDSRSLETVEFQAFGGQILILLPEWIKATEPKE